MILGGAIYSKKEFLDEFLSRRLGKCFSIPVGVIKYTFANGRSKGKILC